MPKYIDPTVWLDEQQRVVDAATPGPWWITLDPGDPLKVGPLGGTICEMSGDNTFNNARSIVGAHDTLPTMMVALRAVLELHRRRPHNPATDPVVHGQTEFPDLCDHCRRTWPCDTFTALDRAIDENRHG